MENSDYLGIAGKVGHDPEIVRKYNALLKLLGEGGMLVQLERWADDGDLESIIQFIENNLCENGISLPYQQNKWAELEERLWDALYSSDRVSPDERVMVLNLVKVGMTQA